MHGKTVSAGQIRPTIGVYVPYFLTISMTFVYRQLLGVSEDFYPIVLTQETDHEDVFPFANPILRRRPRWYEKPWLRLETGLHGKFIALTPSQRRAWRREIARLDVRLLHAHFGPGGLSALPLARSSGIPLLVTFHGYDASLLLRNEKYLKGLQGLFDYAHVVTVSRDMADRLVSLGADPDRTTTHYIGIPTDRFRPVDRPLPRTKVAEGDTLRFLQVSNFVEKKGHEYTVRAFSEFLDSYPDATLTLAGDGPLRARIQSLCNQMKIDDRVHFVGKVDESRVIPLMESADVFLHHSVTTEAGDMEGIPTVIMEAMATGLPVVSTYHSGIPELVEHEHSGLLVAERNVRAYVDALRQVVQTSTPLGLNAVDRVRNRFDISRQNAELCSIYSRLTLESS